MENNHLALDSSTSINRTLTSWLLATAALILVTTCGAFVTYDFITLRRAMVSDAQTLADVVAINVAVAIELDDPSAGVLALNALSNVKRVRAAVIYDNSDVEFARWANSSSRTEEIYAPRVGETGTQTADQGLEVSRNIEFDTRRVGKIYLNIDTSELRARVQAYLIIMACIFATAGAFAIYVSAVLRRKISEPLAMLALGSAAVASGDLAARVDGIQNTDEIGVLAQSFNFMSDSLRKLISRVSESTSDVGSTISSLRDCTSRLALAVDRQKVAITETSDSVGLVASSSIEVNRRVETLAASSIEVASSIHETNVSIGEITGHMSHLATSLETSSSQMQQVTNRIGIVTSGVGDLERGTDDSLTKLSDLQNSVATVKSNAQQSHELSEDTTQEALRGKNAVVETVDAMKEISTSFEELDDRVGRLSQKSSSISEIVAAMASVAEQTNLLALNAAIIAAQSGEHGKPFAVVAEQIKTLSDQTRISTGEIDVLIQSVKNEILAAVAAASDGAQKVERGVKCSSVAADVLERIAEKSRASTHRVGEIAESSTRQATDLDRVSTAMLGLKEIMANVIQASKEQHESCAEITESVESVRDLGDAVLNATREQSLGSARISEAMNEVTDMVQGILRATQSQSKGSATIQDALEVFRDVTSETVDQSSAIGEMVQSLSHLAGQLEREIDNFKTE
jgi:methyl-accepting chemotaxis protein